MGESGKHETTETVDSVINRIGKSPNFLMFVVATCAMSCSYVGTFFAFMVQFTGFIPNEEYICISQKCLTLKINFTSELKEVDSKFYDIATICDNAMIHGLDFKWDISRTTFAIDFDKICKPSELSLLNSLYFVGGSISLLCGTVAFETLGRRKTAVLGGLFGTISTFMGTFCNSYNFMIAIRLLQGIGNFVSFAGTYIWVLEFVPEQYRIYYNTWSMLIWCIGYPLLVCTSFFIHNWNYIFLASSLAVAITYIPVFLLPDSPRYLMTLGKVEEAKKVLVMYAKLAKKPINLDDVNLIVGENATKDEGKSTKDRIADILSNKAVLLETLVQWYYWFTSCMLFYFLNYGWSSFGDTPYVNYLFAGLGEAIAYLSLIPIITYFGRRKGMVFVLGMSCACFLLGMIPWQWSELWSFERLMTMASIIGVSAAFALAFLYTNELAPTTHRGLVLSSCSIIARGAAFVGPFVSEIFESSTVKLGVNAVLAGSAALICLLLPETRKLPIPEQTQDVSARRKKQGLVELCG